MTPKSSSTSHLQEEIRRTLDTLYRNGCAVELRAFVKERNYKNTYAGWFDNPNSLIRAALELDAKNGEAYVTLNPVDPNLLGRVVI